MAGTDKKKQQQKTPNEIDTSGLLTRSLYPLKLLEKSNLCYFTLIIPTCLEFLLSEAILGNFAFIL